MSHMRVIFQAIRETLRQAQHQMTTKPGQGATGQAKSKGESYRCIVPFPASSEYELSLQLGDVVTLVRRRQDGWCKGTHHRSVRRAVSEELDNQDPSRDKHKFIPIPD